MTPAQPVEITRYQHLEQSLENWVKHCKNPQTALASLRAVVHPGFRAVLPSSDLTASLIPGTEDAVRLGGFAATFAAYDYVTEPSPLIAAAHAMERQFFLGQLLPDDLSTDEWRALLYVAWKHRQHQKAGETREEGPGYIGFLLDKIRASVGGG